MAGETEELIRHDFQAGSSLSGSISFGRFESEILCWERRSSFSQNRYLEEVEKCSRPGSVTEKKAYFEAHFRKKGILPLSSPSEVKYRTSENDISEKTGYGDEGTNQIKISSYGTSTREARLEPSCDGTDNNDGILERGEIEESCSKFGSFSENEVRENRDGEESNFDTSNVLNVTIDPSDDDHAKSQRGSSSKEKCTKPTSMPSKGSEEKTRKTVNNVVMRSKIENKTSKAKGDDYTIKRSEKISRNIRNEELRSATLLKVSSRVRQSENRIISATGTPRPCIKQDDSRLGFKCNERAERRKEFDELEKRKHLKDAHKKHQHQAKTNEKEEAELKQLRKSLNFKAKPLPSFYRGALRDSDRNKATANNAKPGKTRTDCSSTGTKVSESSPETNDNLREASGATSCRSTLTSDSSPSSPCRAVISSTQVGRKKETGKDKITGLHKHKGPEVKKADTGKTTDAKQKKRTGHKTAIQPS